jgi:ketosteroid isomerase-like protein
MSTAANVEAMRAAFAGLQNGEQGPFFGLISDDVVWTVIGTTPVSGTVHGKAAFAERVGRPLQERLAEPIRSSPRQILADGDHVVALWDGTSTMRNGEPYQQSYCWVFRFAGGAIVEATTYWDTDLVNRVFQQ